MVPPRHVKLIEHQKPNIAKDTKSQNGVGTCPQRTLCAHIETPFPFNTSTSESDTLKPPSSARGRECGGMLNGGPK